jgi:hypothetical protein
MRPRRAATLATALALLTAGAAAPARAQEAVNVPWERALPPAPSSTEVQPHPVPGCRDGSLACVRRVERRLRRQWTALDAACDHRAVASLAYLRITELIRKDLSRRRPRFFHDKRYMAFVVTDFSNAYFDAFERYERGLPVPEPWRIFYDAATRGETNAIQDLLLFSNAHAQHDLPFSYGSMGVRAPDGTSHKPDHDGVNEVNVRVIPGVKQEIERRYDPSFRDIPGPADEMAGLEPTKSWREGAWRNAERLVNARTAAEREQVAGQIRANATAWATMIAAPQRPGTRAERDAHCRAA